MCGTRCQRDKRGMMYQLGVGGRWAMGRFLAWAKSLPRGFLLFFLFCSFLFLFSNSFISFVK
jgi:hypothetical protein